MAIDNDKIRELLERADPSMKKRRLEKELDGDGEEQPGLREQLLVAVHTYENQTKLLEKREAQRDKIDDLALDLFDQNLAEIRMLLLFYEGQVELLADQISEKEDQIKALETVGTVSPASSNGNRTQRRARR